MGIFDFFKRNRNNKKNNKNQDFQEEEVKYPEMNLGYKYNDGTTIIANVKFKDVINYTLPNGKSTHLQKVAIMYTNQKTSEFDLKSYYIDPMVMQDENGNYVYDSASYFENLRRVNPGLVDSFFEKGGISKLPSDYIGHLAGNDNVGYSRNFNQQNGFYADYINEYQRKIKEKSEKEQEEKFSREMQQQTNAPHEVSYETSFEGKLTPEMYVDPYRNV